MPHPEQNGRHQAAVYWERVGTDRYNTPTYLDYQEMAVRWELKTFMVRNPDGTSTTYDGQIKVDRKLPERTLFFRGSFAELDLTETDPLLAPVLYEAVDYSETPDVKGRHFERTMKLLRYAGTMPTVDEDEPFGSLTYGDEAITYNDEAVTYGS